MLSRKRFVGSNPTFPTMNEEKRKIYEALSEVIKQESLDLWFETPNNSFDGFKPSDLIEQGKVDRLWDMIFELQNGHPI